MAVCAVCQAPCRSTCTKCGARLCALHKPANARATCTICKRLGTGTVQAIQAIPLSPSSPAHQRRMPSASVKIHTAPLASLDLREQLTWIAERRTQLQQKQARERAYLDRRAARGTHTPTDDAYEADQLLEQDLFEALDLLEVCLQSSISGSTSSSGISTGHTSFLFADPDHNHKIQP